MIILKKRNCCQKNKKDSDKEAVEQRVVFLSIGLCWKIARKGTPIYLCPWQTTRQRMALFRITGLISVWSVISYLELQITWEALKKVWSNDTYLWPLSNVEDLGKVDLKRGIFQGDSLSPVLFVLSMVPLLMILRKMNTSYEWGKKEY